MTFTQFVLSTFDAIALVIGLTVLNWIARPKHYQTYDFILMMITVGIFYMFVVWCVMLNYGVETL